MKQSILFFAGLCLCGSLFGQTAIPAGIVRMWKSENIADSSSGGTFTVSGDKIELVMRLETAEQARRP